MAPRRHTLFLLLVVIGALASVTPGCGSGHEAPAGAPSQGMRLAVLSPALAVILDDMGLRDRIVGRHGFDLVLDSSIPVVGNELGLDYESLIRVRPTHVLMETSERGIPPRLTDLAKQRGWTVLAIPLDESVDQIRAAVEKLNRVLPPTDREARVKRLEAEMDRAWRARPGLGARMGRTLLLVGVDPPGVLGPGSFHFDLVQRLGGHPVPTEGAMFIQMPLEQVVKLDPDSIVLFMPGAKGEADELLGAMGRVGLRAATDRRVMVIRDPLCLTPSTAMIGVADDIARQAAAWAPIEREGAP